MRVFKILKDLCRRSRDRREAVAGQTLSSNRAFDADERAVFKTVERRRRIRRKGDVRRAIAGLER
jgi:hypothetical protein